SRRRCGSKGGTMSVSHDQPVTAGGGSARAPMQFGVLQFFSWPNREVPLPTIYARALDRIDMMESSGGYEAVWLAEHHFNTYSVCPSVHLMGLQVAARTKNLRIGPAISIAPRYHPPRLPEVVGLVCLDSRRPVNWA